MIYADMAIALPIALLAVMLILVSFYSSQVYIASMARSELSTLGMYDRSQVIIGSLEETSANYSTAIATINSLSRVYNLTISLGEYDSFSGCPSVSVCRIVTISNKSYIMVIR